MKKIVIIIAVMFVISVGIGLFFRLTYTSVDFNDKSQLSDFLVNVLSHDTFEEDYGTTSDYDENSAPIVTYEGADTNEMSEVEYDEFTNVYDYFQDDEYVAQNYEEYLKEVLDNADYVVKAKKLYGTDVLAGSLRQKIYIEEVYRGDSSIKGESAYLITSQTIIYLQEGVRYIGSFVNLMNEGDEYIVFMNKTPSSAAGIMFYVPEVNAVSWFNLKDIDNILPKDSGEIYYDEVKDNEFFAGDNDTLEKLLELKQYAIGKFVE